MRRALAWIVAGLLAGGVAESRAEPAAPAPRAQLVEVLGAGKQALLLDRARGEYALVRLGDGFAGLRVVDIAVDQIVLAATDGTRYVLPLVARGPEAKGRPGPTAVPLAPGREPLSPYGPLDGAAAPAEATVLDPYGSAPPRSPSSGRGLDPFAGGPRGPTASGSRVLDPYGAPAGVPGDGSVPAVVAPPGSRAPEAAATEAPATEAPATEPQPPQAHPPPADPPRQATTQSPPVVRPAERRAGPGVSEETHVLSRRELDRALSDFHALSREMKIDVVPGKGVALEDVGRGSLAHRLGLRTGDLVLSIADRRVDSVDSAAAVFVALATVDSFRVVVERSGKRITLRFRLMP